jgi:hypothetical protein
MPVETVDRGRWTVKGTQGTGLTKSGLWALGMERLREQRHTILPVLDAG